MAATIKIKKNKRLEDSKPINAKNFNKKCRQLKFQEAPCDQCSKGQEENILLPQLT